MLLLVVLVGRLVVSCDARCMLNRVEVPVCSVGVAVMLLLRVGWCLLADSQPGPAAALKAWWNIVVVVLVIVAGAMHCGRSCCTMQSCNQPVELLYGVCELRSTVQQVGKAHSISHH